MVQYILLSMVFLFVTVNYVSAACTVPIGGDAGITVTEVQPMLLGTITKPDTGSSSAIIRTDNTRILPAELSINTNNASNHGDTIQAAMFRINGSPDCAFKTSITSSNAALTSFTIEGVSQSLTNLGGGEYQGVLSASGSAIISVGASVDITSSSSTFNIGYNLTTEFLP